MKVSVLALSLLLMPSFGVAGQQYCGDTLVAEQVSRCEDGSIPIYKADTIKLNKPAQTIPTKPDNPVKPQATDASSFMGVWRTNVPGAVWESPSGYEGYNWLNVGVGRATGDLIIKPDHTYIWQAYGGKTGQWEQGTSDYPVILIDTVENRRWQLSYDPYRTGGREITVWDGNAYYYDGRR